MNNNMPFCDNPDLLCVTGSRLYGVAKPDSDEDLRGFVAEPSEYLIGLENFEQQEYSDVDTVIYGMRKFFKILIQGNTNALEVLFSPLVKNKTDIGRVVVNNRDLFVSKAYYRAIRGFSLCEWRKARAVTLKMEYQDEESEDLFAKLAGKYQLKRFEINDVMDVIFNGREGDPRKEIVGTRHLGERRKSDVEEFGFSVKNAYHAIRLLDQGIELMSTGHMTFPRPNADELKAIRNGEVSIEDLEKRYVELDDKFQEAADKSSLPTHADRKKINILFMDCVNTRIRQKI